MARPASVCTVRLYAELNAVLPEDIQFRAFQYSVPLRSTVGDIAKALGVPFEEIDLVLVNGASTEFSHVVGSGDRLSFYPVFESFDISSLVQMRPKPLRVVRFILDVHLGKLAHYLRMLGFDSVYRNDFKDEELVDGSIREDRILLSKDRDLLADESIQRSYLVRERLPRQQVAEVLKRFDLFGSCLPLQRCMRCNVILNKAEKENVLDRLPPRVKIAFHEFQECPACRRVYWKGSHYERMTEFIASVLAPAPNAP